MIGLPKAFARPSIPGRLFESAAGHPHRGRRHHRAGTVEDLHGYHEAIAFVAQQVLARYPHVLEKHLAGPRGMLPHFADRLAGAYARRAALHDENAHALVAGLRVGLGKYTEEARHRRVGDPRLRAVDDVFLAVATGCGEDAGHVGAGCRLGEAIGSQMAAVRQPGQVASLLLVVSCQDEGAGCQAVQHDGRLDARAAPGQLLVDQALVEDGQAGAAVLLGDVEADQAGLLGCSHDRPGILIRLVIVGGHGQDLVGGKIVGQVADHLLFV